MWKIREVKDSWSNVPVPTYKYYVLKKVSILWGLISWWQYAGNYKKAFESEEQARHAKLAYEGEEFTIREIKIPNGQF